MKRPHSTRQIVASWTGVGRAGVFCLMIWMISIQQAAAQPPSPRSEAGLLRAGAATVDISPTQPISIIAGNFLEARASSISDRLYARAIVLDDGASKIALVVVDTCMMPQSLIERARQLASSRCDLPIERIMISATHTHSAPAAMGCLGTRQDEPYAAELPMKLADAIVAAHSHLQPARIGWAFIDDWEHTHNRRWIRKPEAMIVDPFGAATGRAHMHPGYESRDCIGPSGPVDPTLSLISIQSQTGTPLALLANYSQHYFGSKPVSSDYFGLFAKIMSETLGQPGEGNGPFVCAMSQGTSGDLMWMDYGRPAKSTNALEYASELAAYAEKALHSVRYTSDATLSMTEKTLPLKYRVPDPQRLKWAREVAQGIQNGLPKNLPEVYAQEALILHERQETTVKLQAIRIGQLTISTLPNEVYALTGLKLKGQAPTGQHFNIELAGGAEGYIPPPEQHALGGYTTWPARTAGLEVEAEPQIVATLLAALEEVTGMPRRTMLDQHGDYALAILQSGPWSYWRLNDHEGRAARNAVDSRPAAQISGGFAWYLPGAGSGTGIGDQAHLKRSTFSGPGQINRAVHLASGQMLAHLPASEDFSIVGWVWLGVESGASRRSGAFCTLPSGQRVLIHQDASHNVHLECEGSMSNPVGRADDWHMISVVAEKKTLHVYVDGSEEPALQTALKVSDAVPASDKTVTLGTELQGKLDEVAVFARALTPKERLRFWSLSGAGRDHQRSLAERSRAAEMRLETSAPGPVPQPAFDPGYGARVKALSPIFYHALGELPDGIESIGQIAFSPEKLAEFRDGRLAGKLDALGEQFSISLWFANRLPTNSRPVTAYLFSRGPDGDNHAPGDHLGIGGTYRADLTGRLILFNGNARDQVLVGRTSLRPNHWHHVVLVREPGRAKAFLDGNPRPEFDAVIDSTAADAREFFIGARCDRFAPLDGHIAHVAIFDRALTDAQCNSLHSASGTPTKISTTPTQESSKSASEMHDPSPPVIRPLSPEESLAAIEVAHGFRVELVAAEPLVLDPVAFDWDDRGRLWVVEMADYPSGMDGKGAPGGRVRILEDTDGDGRYDASQLFAEGLNFPNGILTWRDSAIVTAAPDVLLVRDADGDGRAEQIEKLLTGFQEGNQQLRVNGLRWGLDGWVYCAGGGHHPGYGVGTKITSWRQGRSYDLGSRDFRFHPDSGDVVLESGPSQFGRNRDWMGHWFGVQNAKPLWQYVIADRYLARNPYVPAASPIHFVLPAGSPPVYPASLPEKRFHSFQEAGHFTSACSASIYGDKLLFGDTQQLHAFTCEPFHNLVQHNVLAQEGVTFRASRPVGEGRFDFFANRDRWSRPVMVRTGPDGALWIADMMRYMIEHPDWLPPEGKAELLPHYRLGDDLGRIYRIVPENHSESTRWQFDSTQPAGLLKCLESFNDWQRDKAQQLITWSADWEMAAALERLVQEGQHAPARLSALATLKTLATVCGKTVSEQVLIQALNDRDPGVRAWSVLLAEERDEAGLMAAVLRLSEDEDANVALQLALSAGQWRGSAAGECLVRLARRWHTNAFLRTAIMSSALSHTQIFAQGIIRSSADVQDAFREALVRQAIGAQDPSLLAIFLEQALQRAEQSDLQQLDTLLLVLQRVHKDDIEQLRQWDASGSLSPLLARLERLCDALAGSSSVTSDSPLAEIARQILTDRLLSRIPSHRASAVRRLAKWLTPKTDIDLQVRVLETLGQSGQAGVPNLLAGAWPEMTPAIRAKAIDIWSSRTAWASDLLDRIEQEQVRAVDLGLEQRSMLLRYPDKPIAERASVVLAGTRVSSRPARRQVVDQYRSALTATGDARRGRAIYERACASCHRRQDVGFEVGPNMATVLQHSRERLLTNILDPNADIQPGYQAYNAMLQTGEILSGLLAGETANSLTIKQSGGTTRTLLREEVERLQNTNLSLMPEGLETSINPEDMANLLEFILKG